MAQGQKILRLRRGTGSGCSGYSASSTGWRRATSTCCMRAIGWRAARGTVPLCQGVAAASGLCRPSSGWRVEGASDQCRASSHPRAGIRPGPRAPVFKGSGLGGLHPLGRTATAGPGQPCAGCSSVEPRALPLGPGSTLHTRRGCLIGGPCRGPPGMGSAPAPIPNGGSAGASRWSARGRLLVLIPPLVVRWHILPRGSL